jgi:Dolichyl-phosphate-mannose-protein mannosyltransferase
MVELRRFGFLDFILLLLVLAVAGGSRAGYLITCCDNGRAPGPLLVQDPRIGFDSLGAVVSTDVQAGRGGGTPPGGGGGGGGGGGAPRRRRVAAENTTPVVAGFGSATELDDLVSSVDSSIKEGRFLGLEMYNSRSPIATRSERSAYTAPGYPLIVGLLANRISSDQLGAVIRWGQCVLGALTAGLYFLFARRAFGGSLIVATLAGIFCAVHPFWVIDTATIDDGVLTTFLLAAAMFFGARGAQSSGALSSLLYGLALVALALTRAALLPFAVVALLWFLLRSRSIVHGWLCALLAFLGFAIGFTPWLVYNWQRFHEVVPVVDSAYASLWEGNHRHATGGPASTADWISVRDLAGLSRQHRYTELGAQMETEVKRDQVETVRRRLAAGLYFFVGEQWFRDGQLAEEVPGAEEMPDWLARSYPGALAGSLFAMLLLGVLGWRWTYGWRFLAMPSSLAVMWIPLPYILSHADALSGPRLPLDGVLLTYAAFAIVCLVPRLSPWLLAGYRPVVREVVARR